MYTYETNKYNFMFIPNFRKFGSSDLEKMRYKWTDERTTGRFSLKNRTNIKVFLDSKTVPCMVYFTKLRQELLAKGDVRLAVSNHKRFTRGVWQS